MTNGFTSVMFIALLGLANSLMWPSIWPLAIAELGRFTKVGSSMMVMAISGAAVLPLLYGRIADISTPKSAYWIVIPIYLFVFFYAVRDIRSAADKIIIKKGYTEVHRESQRDTEMFCHVIFSVHP